MKIAKAIKLLLTNNKGFIIRFLQKYPFFSSDEFYIKKKFEYMMGKPLNLRSPITFKEKIQWLKLFYQEGSLTDLVDKVKVKDFVAKTIGKQYLIPTIGVWDSFSKINFDNLPEQFVLKTNHDFGGVVICKDKKIFDFQGGGAKLNKHLKRNFFSIGREWAYKNVTPKILAEQYLGKLGDDDVKDYKFYCFDGEPKLLLVTSGRQKGHENMKWNFYDINFNPLRLTKSNIASDFNAEKPKNFEVMVELSKKLAVGFPFVRTDFYNIDGEIFFGELTFYPGGGYGKFEPEEWDYKLGSFLNLPMKT